MVTNLKRVTRTLTVTISADTSEDADGVQGALAQLLPFIAAQGDFPTGVTVTTDPAFPSLVADLPAGAIITGG